MYESAYLKVKFEIADLLRAAVAKLGYPVVSIDNTIELSQKFGDISSSVSFRLAKGQKKSAVAMAAELASSIQRPDNIEKITTENGFVNFHLNKQKFTGLVLESGAVPESHNKGRIIIEYPSVNPNKPWHIGHLRNALLGDSLSNIYAALGYDVEREDYINDLGLQMAETLWWYLKSEHGMIEKKFDHWLGEEYVKANEHINEGSSKDEISKIMELMSQDGTYESNMLRDIVSECIKAQHKTASDYMLFHSLMVWESDIVREQLLEKSLALLKKYSFIKTPNNGDYANCTVIDLTEMKDLPEGLKGLKEEMKVLIRSNGAATYLAKDIAFHMWKFGMLDNTFKFSVFMKQDNGMQLYTTGIGGKGMVFSKANTVINIIDVRQSHPQSVLRAAFKAMGKDVAENIMHLAYGEVELESGTLSGRKGTWMGYSADDLLRETESNARNLMSTRFKFSESDEQLIINSIALSAIKFEFLRISPEKKIIFSWSRALNFEGNSGPYAQYMHARSTRILEDAPKELLRAQLTIQELTDQEFALIKCISKEMAIAEKAAAELRPNVITEYINELAYAFAVFYENSPILKAESDEEKIFRLRITLAFKNTMKSMLELLGIEALERM